MKKLLFVSVYCFFFQLANCLAQGLNSGTIEKLSKLTVIGKGDSDTGVISVTGFVYKIVEDSAYIIISQNVFSGSETIELTLFSGTSKEKKLKAKLYCNSESNSIAVIKTKASFFKTTSIKNSSENLYQTMPLYIMGFPFGEEISEGERSPEPTISKAAVSGFNKNNDGSISFIRVDTTIAPGYQGGPAVDKEGRLLGVLHGGLPGTRIGGVLPSLYIEKLFNGYVKTVKIGRLLNDNGTYKLEVESSLFNPVNGIEKISVAVIHEKDLKDKNRKSKSQSITDASKYQQLTIEEQTAKGIIELGKLKGKKADLAIQFKYSDRSSKVKYLKYKLYKAYLDKAVSLKNDDQDDDKGDDWLPKTQIGSDNTPKPVTQKITPLKKISHDNAMISEFDDKAVLKREFFWGKDKKYFYIYNDKNVLRKIVFPACDKETKLEFQEKISSAGLSKEGLVVMCPDSDELWLFDDETLKLKGAIRVPKGWHVETSANLSIAFVTPKRENGSFLSIIDLKKGKLLRKIDVNTFRQKNLLSHFYPVKVSSDGRFLFVSDHSHFNIFKIVRQYGAEVNLSIYKSIKKGLGVAALTEGSLYFGTGSGEIYSINNLNNPIFKLPKGKRMYFDKKFNRIIYSGDDNNLLVFDAKSAKKLKEYSFRLKKIDRELNDITIDKFLFCPESKTLITTGFNRFYKIKFPNLPCGSRNNDTTYWVGGDAPKPLLKGRPQKRILPLNGEKTRDLDAEITKFKLGKDRLLPNILWSKDKEYIYICSEKGLIRKIAMPSLIQEYVIDLQESVAQLQMSKSHLIVITDKLFYTLSPLNLKIIRKEGLVNFTEYFTSNTKKPIYFYRFTASSYSDIAYGTKGNEVYIFDVKNIKTISKISSREFKEKYGKSIKRHHTSGTGDISPDLFEVKISPDGKYLYTSSSRLYKFKIIGNTLKYIEVGPKVHVNGYFSQDAKHVLLPLPHGNESLRSALGAPNHATLIYPVNDLSKAIGYINTGQSVDDIIYNKTNKHNYVLSSQLFKFSKDGALLKQYEKNRFDAISAIPGENDFIAIGEKNLCLITFNPESKDESISAAKMEENKSSLGKEIIIDNLKLFPIEIKDKFSKKRIQDIEFLNNGKECIAVTSNEEPYNSVSLHKLKLPDFTEECRLKLNYRAYINVSKNGICLLIPKLKELRILNPKDLSLKGKIPLGDYYKNKDKIVCSPSLAFAYRIYSSPFEQLWLLDLKKNKILWQKECRDIAKNLSNNFKGNFSPDLNYEMDCLNISNDGKYLLHSDHGKLHRYTVSSKGKLTLEEVSRKISSSFFISEDSQYLVTTENKPDHQVTKDIVVYKINDFSKTVMKLPLKRIDNFGFDVEAKRLYTANLEKGLMVYSPQGKLIKSYQNGVTNNIYKILVHPEGNGKIIIFTSSGMYWAEIGE